MSMAVFDYNYFEFLQLWGPSQPAYILRFSSFIWWTACSMCKFPASYKKEYWPYFTFCTYNKPVVATPIKDRDGISMGSGTIPGKEWEQREKCRLSFCSSNTFFTGYPMSFKENKVGVFLCNSEQKILDVYSRCLLLNNIYYIMVTGATCVCFQSVRCKKSAWQHRHCP